ncbi:MAG: glycoside hydrolase 5 family protein [Armatimonadota bacterium]
MFYRLMIAIAVALTALPALYAAEAAPVKAAFMYCDWPEGKASFKNDFDTSFAALGWQVTKFENRQAKELSERLGEFDIVVGGGVSNLTNTVDFAPYAPQWKRFLEDGGTVIATDASYGGVNASWIGGIDKAFSTGSALCSAHTKPSAETTAAKFVDSAPLLTAPHDLRPGLRSKTNWSHLDPVGTGWTVAVSCYDDKPVMIYRAVGKGLLIVTNYFRFSGAGTVGAHLLENAITMAAASRQGMQLVSLTLPEASLGANTGSVKLRNLLDQPAPITARLLLTGKQALPPVMVEQIFPAQAEAQLELPFNLPERGEYTGQLDLMRDGKSFLVMPCKLTVPELVAVSVRSRHQYSHYGKLPVQVTLAPELAGRLQELTVSLRLVGAKTSGTRVATKPANRTFGQTLSLAGLPPDNYRLVATLSQGRQELGRGDALVLLHPEPTVKFNDKNVCHVNGKPLFPVGMYHVAWSASREQMLKCLEDLAGAGFNTVHTSCTNLDTFQAVLDRAQALGLHVIAEGVGAKSEALKRFKDHPAVLAWNSGDEPDCSNTPPVEVGKNIDAVRDVDPNHLLYTTVANPDVLLQYAPYVDVFSNDPYPVAGGRIDTIAVANQTARAREAILQSRPLWMVPQCFGYEKGPWQVPTPAQERSMTYQALIEGANGLIWYVYDDKLFKVLEHPELWAMMKQLAAEIKTLTPILLEPAYDAKRFATGPDNCLRGACIKQGGDLYILTAHSSEKDLGQVELSPPGLPAKATVEVMFENRTVPVSGGKIKDQFGPYAVHVYRVKL